MRGAQDAGIGGRAPIDPGELADILAEVRQAIMAMDQRAAPAVDVGTGEYRPLRDIDLARRGIS